MWHGVADRLFRLSSELNLTRTGKTLSSCSFVSTNLTDWSRRDCQTFGRWWVSCLLHNYWSWGKQTNLFNISRVSPCETKFSAFPTCGLGDPHVRQPMVPHPLLSQVPPLPCLQGPRCLHAPGHWHHLPGSSMMFCAYSLIPTPGVFGSFDDGKEGSAGSRLWGHHEVFQS